jgi:hypothetical protein
MKDVGEGEIFSTAVKNPAGKPAGLYVVIKNYSRVAKCLMVRHI